MLHPWLPVLPSLCCYDSSGHTWSLTVPMQFMIKAAEHLKKWMDAHLICVIAIWCLPQPPAESTSPRVFTRWSPPPYAGCRGTNFKCMKNQLLRLLSVSALWAWTHTRTRTHTHITVYATVCLWVGGRWRKRAVTALLRRADKSPDWTPWEGERQKKKPTHCDSPSWAGLDVTSSDKVPGLALSDCPRRWRGGIPSPHTHTHTSSFCLLYRRLWLHVAPIARSPPVSLSYVISSKRELVERQKKKEWEDLVFTVFSVFLISKALFDLVSLVHVQSYHMTCLHVDTHITSDKVFHITLRVFLWNTIIEN